MDLISIIVPIYNVQDYLEQCIQSIVNQTYPNLEIILVNDGSRDRCPEICDEWAKRDKRIKVVHQGNAGVAEARNCGIELASGKYIGFVDSDDFIEKTMYQHLLESIKKADADIAACGSIKYLDGVKKYYIFGKNEDRFGPEEALGHMLKREYIGVSLWDKLFKRELFQNVRLPKRTVNEDVAVTYRLIAKANYIIYTGTSEYYYRTRRGSATKSEFSLQKMNEVFLTLDELESFVRYKYPGILHLFFQYKAVDIFYLLLSYLKSELPMDDEYLFLIDNYKSVRKYLYLNSSISLKDKMISAMIILKIYKPYIVLKNKLIGHR